MAAPRQYRVETCEHDSSPWSDGVLHTREGAWKNIRLLAAKMCRAGRDQHGAASTVEMFLCTRRICVTCASEELCSVQRHAGTWRRVICSWGLI